MSSLNKSVTFHLITPNSDFTIGRKSSVDTYIDPAYEKTWKFDNLISKILQSVKENIKILFDNKFDIFMSK